MVTEIELNGTPRQVEITRKAMRSIRLRVTDAGEIRLSAPKGTPKRELDAFLRAHRAWLEAALARLDEKAPPMQAERLEQGAPVRLLGMEYTVELRPGVRIGFSADHAARTLRIERPEGAGQAALDTHFDRWWRESCLAVYTGLCRRYLPLFAPYGVRMPEIHVRKMRAQWGSCNAAAGRINLNYYLLRAPLVCVEYVVLHELTHLINQTHNPAFYAFIARAMPDWKARRERLRHERSC